MDTIVALGTPSGRSAIGVIRLSGPTSLAIARSLTNDPEFTPEPGHAVLRGIRSQDQQEILDQSLLTYFHAPNSYTGEDVVEISCHGSPIVLRQVIDLTLRFGARLAGPGEFTLRALGNGKLSLSQAEGIRDLINSQTEAAAQQAARQLMGELSLRLKPSKEKLIEIIVQLESALEFVEDDLPRLRKEHLHQELLTIVRTLDQLATTFQVGHLLRDGLRVTIAGRPNVGKSSLFNKLLSSERAIVTELPGTTRDTLTEPISLNGVPVLLTDTAGVRDSLDKIEELGVVRTRQAMADADLLVIVVDGSVDLSDEDLELLARAKETRHLVAINKSDLPSFQLLAQGRRAIAATTVEISARSGCGLEGLRAAILSSFGSLDATNGGLLITNARHHDLLRRASVEIEAASDLLAQNTSEEMVLVGLHNALRFLGEITGETTSEDILGQIFATFCIGK